jgi:predicted flap endonuclease-1-like 5' DNA nuclease
MGFLIAKILLLMLGAATLGALAAHWWLRRQYEDVTTEYRRMEGDWATWRRDIEVRLAKQLPVDLAPLHSRLAALEAALKAIHIPPANEVDLGGLHARIASLEHTVLSIRLPEIPPSTTVDLEPVLRKLESLETRSVALPVTLQKSHVVRPGSRNLLAHPAYGRPDDLQKIKGVKRVMERMLHEIGVYYFWQIAEWTDDDARHADEQLTAFHGRIGRDDWVNQASQLTALPDAARKPQV